LVEKRLMAPEEAARTPMQNVVLQVIGQPRLEVALGRLPLRKDDILLLCSDGLTKELAEPEMRAILASSPDPCVTCPALVDRALAHGGHDNITVIVARVTGDLPAAAPHERVKDELERIKEFDAPEDELRQRRARATRNG
jgi:protein phosphatase